MAESARRVIGSHVGDPPPGLYRTTRPDLLIRFAGYAVTKFVSGVMRLGGDGELPELAHARNRRAMLVVRRRNVARDGTVVELTVAAHDGTALPPWHPGAHIDTHLPSGRTRQYSLCGDPRRTQEYRFAVRRTCDGSGSSKEAHGLRVNQVIEISTPRNAFLMPLPGSASRAQRLHFIAGGIGITPILPMARLAERTGVPWSLCYIGRHRDNLPFLDELSVFGDKVRVHTTDQHGRPGTTELLAGADETTAVYVCGPPPMVDAVRRTVAPGPELHFERFSPLPVVDGKPFEVMLARSATVIQVGAQQSTLAALQSYLPHVSYSCRQGYCGSCVQQVLAGDVDHRDNLLTDEQRELGQMLVCVSRAKPTSAPLVLDL